ncbi:MAG: glutamate synthase subunit beta [candidate division NC10 bacterium]|nr:glutamate synthase subunit beta [candidate division NC10 bacterium]
MGKPTGFLEIEREMPPRRSVEERVRDYQEIYLTLPENTLRAQGARCMDCGVPFCHQGCPLRNIIPDWNDLVYRNRWREALDRLLATNDFPEFTGRLCPAPCEGSCVLGINAKPVTIKQIELVIIERGFREGWVRPEPPLVRTGKSVAVVGSGPAGLAAAQQLNRAGHWVTVFERADRIGGLMRYGIPEFKLEKHILDRRLRLMTAEGVTFRTRANVGEDISAETLQRSFDAVLLAGGATLPRDLHVPGRDFDGIHFAMEYLPLQNRRCLGDLIPDERFISARGRRVVIIGGGDTGADCLGTAHRQGAVSVHQLELLPAPPQERAPNNPWPLWPNIFRSSSAHEEGGTRDFCVSTKRFSGTNGTVERLHAIRMEFEPDGKGGQRMREIPRSEFEIPADLVLLAMGFLGPERNGMLSQFGVSMTTRGNVAVNDDKMTSVPGVFAAGDMARGQSLIVWAITEGRQAARGVDRFLMGTTNLR